MRRKIGVSVSAETANGFALSFGYGPCVEVHRHLKASVAQEILNGTRVYIVSIQTGRKRVPKVMQPAWSKPTGGLHRLEVE